MADFVAYPRVKMTATTTGTGTFTLGSAVAGYQAFSVVGDANKCFYFIEAIDANGIPTGDWEEGKGTYTTSGTTLSRDTIIASSNSGSAVNFSAGSKYVALTLPSSAVNTFAASGTGSYPGCVPNPGTTAGTTAFLREDATWVDLIGGGSLLASNTSNPAGNTSTSTFETTLTSHYVIPANTMTVGDVFRVRLYGTYGNNATVPTFRLKIKVDADTVQDTQNFSGLVQGTDLGWFSDTELIVWSTGVSGQIMAQGYAEFSTGTTTGLSVNMANNGPTTSVNTTINKDITVTVDWGSGGTPTVTLREFIVQKLSINVLISADIIILREEQNSGNNGGTFTSGAWQTRILNTKTNDTNNNCTLSSNQFTLNAGIYEIFATAPAYIVENHRAKLRNITDSTDVIIGTSEISNTSDTTQTKSIVQGIFTITSTKTFELQHRCSTTRTTNGFGDGNSVIGVVEVFSTVYLRKVG